MDDLSTADDTRRRLDLRMILHRWLIAARPAADARPCPRLLPVRDPPRPPEVRRAADGLMRRGHLAALSVAADRTRLDAEVRRDILPSSITRLPGLAAQLLSPTHSLRSSSALNRDAMTPAHAGKP